MTMEILSLHLRRKPVIRILHRRRQIRKRWPMRRQRYLSKTVAIEYKYVESQREYDALPELRGMFDGNDIVIETVE